MADLEDFATEVGALIKTGRFATASNLVGADLNALTAPGSYGYWDNALNAPSALRGNVIVSELRTTGGTLENVYQLALERDGRIWMRDWNRPGNAWRAWAQVSMEGGAQTPQSTQLPNGGDLNAATTPGAYGYAGQGGSIRAMVNAPTALPGTLHVSEVRSSSGVLDQINQIAIEEWGGVYTRTWRRLTDAWTVWHRAGGLKATPAVPSAPGLKVVPLPLSVGSGDQNSGWAERGIRIPIKFNAPVGRWRLHVRNWNPFSTNVRTGSVAITGLWLGEHAGSGVPTGTRKLMDASTTPEDGSEWVSPWMDGNLGGNVERLLMLGYTGAGSTGPYGIRGASWQTVSAADVTEAGATAMQSSVFPFEMWIEAETPVTTTVVAAVGDSLTSGANATGNLFDSWLSQYCRRVGALPMHVSAHGDSMINMLRTGAGKYERWAKFAPADAVIWAMGSNDIGPKPTVETLTSNFRMLRDVIERSVGPVRYATTITPRGVKWDAGQTALWEAWNAKLPKLADWAAILDFAAVVGGGTGAVLPQYDSGDGVHLNGAGYKAEADSIQTPLALTPAPVTSYDSGLRDITALATGITSGAIRFRVKGGWARLTFTNVQVATAGSVYPFSNDGPLAPWSPLGGETGVGFLTKGDNGQTVRVNINNRGSVALYGTPTATNLTGYAMWPFDRPIPANPIGV